MSVFTHTAKRVALATGLYRPARWLSTRVRRGEFKSFRETAALYRSLLPREALCFDVGANLGDKSAALLAAGARRVVAFEPNPLIVPELRARCGHDLRWTMIEAAIGREPALQTLYANAAHGASSLSRDWGAHVIAQPQVHVVTLDAAICMWGVPDYCKIDVEGWELEVLFGLSRPIPLVSFEFHLSAAGTEQAKACLARLAELTPNARVNLTPAESSQLHSTAWRPIEDMIDWFPGDLKRSLPGEAYGDLFVKVAAPT